MKKRVIKGYNGLGEIFIPQYKRSFFSALFHREFGWKYYYKEGTERNKQELVRYYDINKAIAHCKKKSVHQQFEVVWDDAKQAEDIV